MDNKQQLLISSDYTMPFLGLLPRLSDDQYQELKANIQKRGIVVPILIDENKGVIDGNHRLMIAQELGILNKVKFETRPGLSEAEKKEFAYDLNLKRRHLSREQRQEIAQQMRQDGMSYRAIGEKLSVSHDTAKRDIDKSTVRNLTVDYPDRIVGKDGKSRPAKKKAFEQTQPNILTLEATQPSWIEFADQEVEAGRAYTEDEWRLKPDEYIGGCYKQCYANRVMVKGDVLEYGVRGVYVCTGCDYAYPPMYEPEEVEQNRNKMAIHYSSETPEHYTPQSIIDAAIQCMGVIDLDPCSNSKEAPNVSAFQHFTIEDDGLSLDWTGRVYMNPPYGRAISDWVDKLCSEHKAGRVTEAIALVPSRTDTKWFGKLRDYPVCFVSGRLKFLGNEDPAPFPSAIFYLGDNIDVFYYTFILIGDIWQKLEQGMFGQ